MAQTYTITYNPVDGGKAVLSVASITDDQRRHLRKAGFTFHEGRNEGMFVPGGKDFDTIVADMSTRFTDTVTLTQDTALGHGA